MKKNPMKRLCTCSIANIFELLSSEYNSKTRVELFGEFGSVLVKAATKRLVNFKLHGVRCVSCGIEGKFFAIETPVKGVVNYHLNLYAYDKDGDEVLMTNDHIIPLSSNGNDTLDNMQTMCKPCNERKESKL